MATAPATDPNSRFRAILATAIVCLSIVGIVALSWISIVMLRGEDRTEMTRLVFSAVLPLLGTWVGTVLAFYFARESLQAATDSTNQLVGSRTDPLTPVTRVMIPSAKVTAHAVPSGGRAETVSLTDLAKEMSDAGRHRIPIVDATGVVSYVVHEATINKFISIPPVPAAATAPPAHPLAGKTVADLLAVSELADLIKAIGYVPVTGTIADARTEMRRVANCNDVFVTARGRNDEPFLGWITNSDLASES
jgi:hypothetical protein